MKLNITTYAIGALMLSAALSSCDDNFERPPMIIPSGNDVSANILLETVKYNYWANVSGSPTQIGFWTEDGETDGMTHAIGDSIIFVGRVASSDESGNIYKNIVIQNITDDPAQQVAITFAVNQTKLYQSYPYGAEVVVYASDLWVGGYSGLMQFGNAASGSMTFMDADVFTQHVQLRSGLPNASKVVVTETTLDELVAAKANSAELCKWQSRLVKIKDVHFANPGLQFAGDATTNRDLLDANGNKIIVRTSAYADFFNAIIPAGTGSVTGILSYFGSDWQILLINADGCEGFDAVEPDDPDQPVGPGQAVTEIDQNFDAGTEIPAGWTIREIAGNKKWYITTFNNNNYAAMTGYKGTAPFDSWLISPALDIDKAAQKVASFSTQVNGYGSNTTTFKVYVLDNVDPSKANKTELTAALPTAPASGYSSWVASGELDLSSFSGVIYLAFQYAATQDANYATWCVDNVLAGKKAAGTPDTPDTPEEGMLYSMLPETASAMPEDWTIDNVDLGGLESIWSWKTYNEKGYLNASAYAGNTAYASLSYAVSPEIDLTGATGCYLTFDAAAKFQTTLRTMCGVCARVAGTTEWTALTIPTWPEAGNWTFANSGKVDLSAFNGKKIQIAFKYGSTASGADTWEVKNLKVYGTK